MHDSLTALVPTRGDHPHRLHGHTLPNISKCLEALRSRNLPQGPVAGSGAALTVIEHRGRTRAHSHAFRSLKSVNCYHSTTFRSIYL